MSGLARVPRLGGKVAVRRVAVGAHPQKVLGDVIAAARAVPDMVYASPGALLAHLARLSEML